MSDATVMTFTEHLVELRRRLVRVTLAIVIGMLAAWSWRTQIFGLLAGPISRSLADNGIYHYQAIHVTESIVVYMKLSTIFGIILVSPYIVYQLWAFISPGLLDKEKRFVIPVTGFTVLFFLIGAAFAYEVMLPFVSNWLIQLTLQGGQTEVMVTLENTYTTALMFLVLFGLIFELPLIIFFLALFGLVTRRGLTRFYRYFIVVAFVIGAVLTPPDPMSQIMLAVPLNLLYGFGILIAWGVERSRGKEVPQEAGVTLARLMGSSLLLIALAITLVVVLWRVLPEKDIYQSLPDSVSWMVEANPSVLAKSETLNAALGSDAKLGPWLHAVRACGTKLSDIHEVALVGTEDGDRALIVRNDDLGEHVAAVHKAASPYAKTTAVAKLDSNTFAIGTPKLVTDLAAVSRDDADAFDPTEDETRLITKIRTEGPIWAWLPHPAKTGARYLGAGLAKKTGAAGAWLHLGKQPHISLTLLATTRKVANAVAARLDAARTTGRTTELDQDQVIMTRVLEALTAELKRRASADDLPRLEAIETKLHALRRTAPPPDVPILAMLSESTGGWALQRDDQLITLTSELTPANLRLLAKPLLTALR